VGIRRDLGAVYERILETLLNDKKRPVRIYAVPREDRTPAFLTSLGIADTYHAGILANTSRGIVLPGSRIILLDSSDVSKEGLTIMHELIHIAWHDFLKESGRDNTDPAFKTSMEVLRAYAAKLMAMPAPQNKDDKSMSRKDKILVILARYKDSPDEHLDEAITYLLTEPTIYALVNTAETDTEMRKQLSGSLDNTWLDSVKSILSRAANAVYKAAIREFEKRVKGATEAGVGNTTLLPMVFTHMAERVYEQQIGTTDSEDTASIQVRNMANLNPDNYGASLESQLLADGVSPLFAARVGNLIHNTQEQLHKLVADTPEALQDFQEAVSGVRFNAWNTFAPSGVAEALKTAITLPVTQGELIAVNQFENLYTQLLLATTGVGYQFRRQIEAMHAEAVSRYPTPESMLAVLDSPTQADEAQVRELHALLFDRPVSGVDAIAGFAALVIGYQDAARFFDYQAKKPGQPKGTITQRLVYWISEVLTWFESKLGTRTHAGTVNKQLGDALKEMLANQVRFKKWQNKRANKKTNRVTRLAEEISGISGKALESPWVAKSKYAPVRLVNRLYTTAKDGNFQEFIEKLQELRDTRNPDSTHGFLMRTATEMRGVFNKMLPVFGLFNQMRIHENHRQDTIRDVATASLMAFKDGDKLKVKDRSLILDIALRTGFWRLESYFDANVDTANRLKGYLDNPDKLAEERAKILTLISNLGMPKELVDIFNWHSDHLGYFWATGASHTPYLLPNLEAVGLLTRGYHDTYTSPELIKALGALTAAYAVEHQISLLTAQSKARLNTLVSREVERTDTGDGFAFITQLQKDFDKKTENLYVDNWGDMQWQHAQDNWLPSLTDPDAPLTDAPITAEGYDKRIYKGLSEANPNDITPVLHRHNKKADVRSGALVYGRTHIEGTTREFPAIKGKVFPAFPVREEVKDAQGMPRIILANIAAWKQAAKESPADARKNKLPGSVMFFHSDDIFAREYRSLSVRQLTHREKRVHQGAVEDFSEILGAYAGKLYEKQHMLQAQKEIVHGLRQVYKTSDVYKAAEKKGFDLKSDAMKELQAGWIPLTRDLFSDRGELARLPQEIQKMLNDTRSYEEDRLDWNTFWVRKDMYPLVFGERKFSLAERVFNDSNNADQNKLLRAVGDQIVSYLSNYKHIPKTVAREWAWQWVHNKGRITKAMIAEIKDRIVVASVTVFIGNTLSNLYHLVNLGIPFKTILRGYILGHQAATQYRRDFAEVEQLRYQVQIGVGSQPMDVLQRKLRVLEARLHANPVATYIQAGLLPSIVEDVAITEAGHFDLRTQVRDKVFGFIPGAIRGISKEVLMQPGSQVYQGLNTLTQLSDFSARVALMEHWKESKDARPFNEQVLAALDEFVWYDLPSDTRLEWANEVGLIMFSKYFLRIQKILGNIMLKHPVRTLSMGLMDGLVLDVPDAMESLLGIGKMPWELIGDSVLSADEIVAGGGIVNAVF